LFRFIHELRDVADSVAPGTPIAGSLPISTDLLEAVAHDGPRATLFSFVAVCILVIFLFRNIQTIALVLFALILGVTWLAGFILTFHLKVNFFNFIALPITFGIGVDYGVNVFQRYREEGGGNILRVIRHTGGAVALCSFTTVVGYTSLLIAGNQGFVSFGRLAVAGEITCVTAALIALPAYLTLRARRAGTPGALK
jgi:predicted RND superfamily exporter protein